MSMNQKEVRELRRRWQPDRCAVSRIYGCFVNSNKEIISDIDEPLGLMPQADAEKFLSLLKKPLSGRPGQTLLDIEFSTQQVADSDEHRLLSALRSSSLEDTDSRHQFYQTVIDHLSLGENARYLILIACDRYDVPHQGSDGDLHPEEGDSVFPYILCSICPVKEGRPELGYFPGDNEFHCSIGQIVATPELGFLFPAFDDRAANLYHALYYVRKPEELHPDFVDAVFRTELPMSSAEQMEVFQSVLSDSLEEDYNLEVAQTVYERLSERIAQHEEEPDDEQLELSVGEVGAILQDCGVPDDKVSLFQEQCGQQFGEGASLYPNHLINTKRFEIKTERATISIDPAYSYLVKTRVLDGRRYLLIPVDTSVEVNGMPVDLSDSGEY